MAEEAVKVKTKFRVKAIRSLLRGAQRYHYASLQDKNMIVAARHNAYAVALIDALWDLSNEADVHAIAQITLRKLRGEILAMQDKLEGKAFEILQELRRKGINIPS